MVETIASENTLLDDVSQDVLIRAIESMPFFEHGRVAFVRKGISVPTMTDRTGQNFSLNYALDPIHGWREGFNVSNIDRYLEECRTQEVMPFSTLEFSTGQLKIRYPKHGTNVSDNTAVILDGKRFFPHILYRTYHHSGYFANPAKYLKAACEGIADFDRKNYVLEDAHFHLSGNSTCYNRCTMNVKRNIDAGTFCLDILHRDNFNDEQEEMFSRWLDGLVG